MEKVKVLIIGHTAKMGGVETFIYNTTIFSNKEKFEYDYLIHGYDQCVYEDEINNFYGNKEHLFFISKYKKNPFKCIKELIKFYKLNGKKYKYIHLQTGITSEILYVFPYCLFFKAKVIAHSHNGDGKKITNNLFKPIVNFISKKKFACSDIAAKWLFGKKYADSVKIINNGIDTERFLYNDESRNKIRNKYNIGDKLVIGHIGRFSEQKNHDFLIDIFKEVKTKNANSVLMLIGVGELEQDIRSKVTYYGLENDVIFVGAKKNTNEFYNAFDIFVMPSLYEGLPIVGIEAQASGLPCLLSKNISNQIYITDKVKLCPIEKGAEYWANEILSLDRSLKSRENYASIVRKNGFDIKDAVSFLENEYIN